MKLLVKTFKCKMKAMGENQMRKPQWTQTIIIILLVQTEQIPKNEQKTKRLNETFNLGFYSLSNVFSYRKHISSKHNLSVLTISGKSRNIKIIAPFSPSLWYSPNIPWGSFYWPPQFKIFFRNTPRPPCLFDSPYN